MNYHSLIRNIWFNLKEFPDGSINLTYHNFNIAQERKRKNPVFLYRTLIEHNLRISQHSNLEKLARFNPITHSYRRSHGSR